MANRQKAVRMASKGASAKEIRQATGVTGQSARNIVSRAASSSSASSSPAASMQIYQQPNGNPITTQAPARPSHVQPSYVDAGSGRSFNTRFVPGAMQPGQVGYDPATGGGVWTAGGMSDEEIRAFYRSSNPLDGGGDSFISMSGKPASAFTLDGLYGQGVGQAGATAEAQAKQNMGYKDIGSIRQGLKIGSNNIISKKEANKIAKNTGKSFDQVLSKGLSLGYQVANNAVNKSNKAYTKSGRSMYDSMISKTLGSDFFRESGSDPLMDMRRVKPGKGRVYSGSFKLDGAYTPLVESRNPKGNPLGIRTNTAPSGGSNTGGDTSNTGGDTSNTGNSGINTGVTDEPMTPEQMQEASTAGLGMMSGGGMGSGGATKLGRARGRLQRLGINNRGTSLLGRGLQYGNVLNK